MKTNSKSGEFPCALLLESLVSALHQDPSQRRATHNTRARSPSWEVHKVTGTFTQPLRKTSCQVEYHTHAHGISSSASRTWPQAARSATGPSREAGHPQGCPTGRRPGTLLTAPPRHADTGSAPHVAGKPAPGDRHTASCGGAAPPPLPLGPAVSPSSGAVPRAGSAGPAGLSAAVTEPSWEWVSTQPMCLS